MDPPTEVPAQPLSQTGMTDSDTQAGPFSNGKATPIEEPLPQKGTGKDGNDSILSSSKLSTIPQNADEGEKKLSNKELKLQQKAEKQAKRAAQKAHQEGQGSENPQQKQVYQQGPQQSLSGQKAASNAGKPHRSQAAKFNDTNTQHKSNTSSSGRTLPVRATAALAAQNKQAEAEATPRQDKRVEMFSHLYSRERRTTIAGVGREIHPAILTLGIQLRDYVICGSNARCVATLLAFKRVIQSYTTPPSVALPRHLTTHLSHQISYLSSSRPLSTSQGNSIRWLKKLVVELDPKMSDPDARLFLCKSIDQFIREKVSLADEVIAREASNKIVDGDVILVYAKSSVVEKSLVAAHRQGKRFTVVVSDSRPLFEGKNLARGLCRAGLQVQYCLLTGLTSMTKKITKCILGASAMTENGRLYSRAGTAMAAMVAKDTSAAAGIRNSSLSVGPLAAGSVPVIVLCESVKFSSRVLLDSIVNNELGDPDGLVIESHQNDTVLSRPFTISSNIISTGPPAKKGKPDPDANDDDETKKKKQQHDRPLLDDWLNQPNLHLLNLMYDVTPAEYLDMVITELGSIPPTGVSAVNGVWAGEA